MAKNLRIGFIGAGGMAVVHAGWLDATPGAALVAVADPSAQSIANLRERGSGAAGVTAYDDHDEMLAREALDGVVVISPHTLHHMHIRAALRAGCHVLAEKPFVCDMRQGRALLKMATERERVLMVSYQRHFQPEFMYMHDQVRAGRLGTIEYVQAFQAQEWLRVTQGTWRQRPELSGGGQLNDSGSHLLDVIMWTSGLSVSRVYAQSTSFDTEVDINTALSLRFHGGAMGNVSVVGNAPGWHEEVTLVGSKGAIYYRHAMPLHHVDATGQPVEVKLPKGGSNPDANFVGSIRGREEPRVPAESGLRVLQVTQAAWRSAEKGEAVAIPKSRAVVARA